MCSIMNGDHGKFYLGVLTLSPNECGTRARLLELLLQYGANCAIIFSKIRKGSKGHHYTVCWVYGNDALAFFDPIYGFEPPCQIRPQLARRGFMEKKVDVIIGNGIPNRYDFKTSIYLAYHIVDISCIILKYIIYNITGAFSSSIFLATKTPYKQIQKLLTSFKVTITIT